jgi:histone H3/H4
MTEQPARPERSGPETASVMDVPPFKPSLVKAVFGEVTPMHVSRPAAWAAASVTRTVLTEIIDGARRAAAAEARKKLNPGDLLSALDRNVELEVGTKWYDHSPTFQGLTGVLYDAEGVIVPARKRSRSRKPSAVAGAHRFEAGVKKLLRTQGVRAVPAMVRDLNGIASVFLTDLARDAAMVVRRGGAKRFGTGTLVMSGEPAAPPFLKDSLRALPARRADSRTIGRDDILAATTIQLFGGNLRQRALTEAREAAQNTSAAAPPVSSTALAELSHATTQPPSRG